MNTHKRHYMPLLVCCLLLPSLAAAAQPADFEARLELWRNGKLTGESVFRFSNEGEHWTMQSETKGIKGLAWLIRLRENSTGEGEWQDGVPRPLRYERDVHAIKHMRWTAEFDWEAGTVHTVYPDGESDLPLEPGVVDEMAMGLLIRAGLARGEIEWTFRQVDEDEIEEAPFRAEPPRDVQTPLGCMRVFVVDKVRAPDSTRYTRTYYAADHEFAPVLIEHGKQGKEHIEGRVVSLTIDGKPVEPGPDCPQ